MSDRGDYIRPEDMNSRELAEYILEMMHTMMVHHTLWFREVEHQMGFEKALDAMGEAWDKTKKNSVKRLASEFGFEENDGIPAFLENMPKEKQLSLADSIAKNWLAQDGV